MSEVRLHDEEDARREAAVTMLQDRVALMLGYRWYDSDIEHFDRAVQAFADDLVVTAFKRGVQWRQATNAPLPPDAEIVTKAWSK